MFAQADSRVAPLAARQKEIRRSRESFRYHMQVEQHQTPQGWFISFGSFRNHNYGIKRGPIEKHVISVFEVFDLGADC